MLGSGEIVSSAAATMARAGEGGGRRDRLGGGADAAVKDAARG